MTDEYIAHYFSFRIHDSTQPQLVLVAYQKIELGRHSMSEDNIIPLSVPTKATTDQ